MGKKPMNLEGERSRKKGLFKVVVFSGWILVLMREQTDSPYICVASKRRMLLGFFFSFGSINGRNEEGFLC